MQQCSGAEVLGWLTPHGAPRGGRRASTRLDCSPGAAVKQRLKHTLSRFGMIQSLNYLGLLKPEPVFSQHHHRRICSCRCRLLR